MDFIAHFFVKLIAIAQIASIEQLGQCDATLLAGDMQGVDKEGDFKDASVKALCKTALKPSLAATKAGATIAAAMAAFNEKTAAQKAVAARQDLSEEDKKRAESVRKSHQNTWRTYKKHFQDYQDTAGSKHKKEARLVTTRAREEEEEDD